MRAPTRLVLVRHGQTSWNLQGRLQGHSDSPLTELGQSQAEALARRLAKGPVAALYASDLGRAIATVQPLADVTGLAVRRDVRLRERAFGDFEGMTWPEIRMRHPDQHADFHGDDPDFALPGGESRRQVFDRTRSVMEEVARRHSGESVVLVAHGGTLAAAFRVATHLGLMEKRRFLVPNTGVNVIEHHEDDWLLVTWGDVGHLQGELW